MNFRGRRTSSRELGSHIDLVAMVDVVFQLVLFLLLSMTFQKPEAGDAGDKAETSGFEVDLPRASAHTVMSEDKDIEVFIAKDGSIAVDEQPVDADELRRRFRTAHAAHDDTLVVIRADKGVSHGRVVAVMDLARNEGLTRLAIATDAGSGE